MKQNFRHSYFTLDLEDFCFDFQRSLGIAEPESRPKSILKSLDRVNQILSQSKIDNFTNFVTGQVAHMHPEIVYELSKSGNEIGCHGNFHDNVCDMEKNLFRSELQKAKKSIEIASNQPLLGFRAPRLSIGKDDEWAFDILKENFLYDSSESLEVKGSRYNSSPYYTKSEGFFEIPLLKLKTIFGLKSIVIGGTYFKILPYKEIVRLLDEVIDLGYSPIIYAHPYEFLWEGEFWTDLKKIENKPLGTIQYLRQNQWLKLGNKLFVKKLKKVLDNFPHQGNLKDMFT